jgi:hypothetical protein
MQKQYRRALAALVIGHAGIEHVDALFCQRLFCHWFSPDQWTRFLMTMPRDWVERNKYDFT